MGNNREFDTYSLTVQYMEGITVFKMSSEVIKINAASFGQSPYNARHMPIQGVVGHIMPFKMFKGVSLKNTDEWESEGGVAHHAGNWVHAVVDRLYYLYAVDYHKHWNRVN